jgi:heme/copper-type cytochrome/quinol oxidase subunit 2
MFTTLSGMEVPEWIVTILVEFTLFFFLIKYRRYKNKEKSLRQAQK